MARFIPKHVKNRKDKPVSSIMPVIEARRIQRAQNCANCAFHDFGPDGRTMECHESSPIGALIQTQPNQPPIGVGYWPVVRAEAWCSKHKPYLSASNGNGN